MSRLERLLGELHREVERLQGQAPGTEGPDLKVLTDEELDRLDRLLRRKRGEPVFGPPVSYPTPADERYYTKHPDRNPPRAWKTKREPKPLTEAEREELAGLLQKAHSGEAKPWEGES